MNIELIVFDFDGILADTSKHVINCIKKCIKRFNLKELAQENIKIINDSDLSDIFVSLGTESSNIEQIKEYYNEIFMKELSDISLYDGVFETLCALKENRMLLAIASSRDKKTLFQLLWNLGILEMFDEIICESDVNRKKPKPDMANLLLEEMNITPEQTLIVGNTNCDIQMGKNANCKTGLIIYPEGPQTNIKYKPDYIMTKFDDILKISLPRKVL